MSLWGLIATGPPVAISATPATAEGNKGQLSQLSQLSQGVSGSAASSRAGDLSQLSQLSQGVGDAEREAFEERAAIMEYDGGLSRAEAERQARLGKCDKSRPAGAAAQDARKFEAWGDLRPCVMCRNLTPGGRCLSAWRGELRAARDYAPTFTNLPQRCIGYLPRPDDPEQTTGRERWPELVEWQARAVTE